MLQIEVYFASCRVAKNMHIEKKRAKGFWNANALYKLNITENKTHRIDIRRLLEAAYEFLN